MTGDTGDTHDVGARLRELVLAGDLGALGSHLDALEAAELTEARRWATRTHDVDEGPWPDALGDPRDRDHYDRVRAMRLARLVTWARLAAPGATAKVVAAEGTFLTDEQVDTIAPAFAGRDRAWVEAFAAAADGVRPSARGAALVHRLHLAVVHAHDLPAPSGALFHQAWSQSLGFAVRYGERSGADLLREDPLLPEVVHLQLASGHCGQVPTLGADVAPLVAEGLLDRARLVDDALTHLTAGQRPTAQRTLAGILTALDVSADEVTGGLDLLLSILSSCHASAVAPVLALAVDLVRTGDDAVELARVLAPRTEKGPRRALLGALAPERLGTRVDHAALLEAVEVLAAGDDDVSAAARYDRARQALGGTTPDAPAAPAALGLWGLVIREPSDRPTSHWTRTTPLRDRTWSWLRVGGGNHDPDLVDDLLDALASGETADDLVATAHELALERALSPVQATALLEPLFLGGAMRAAWPVALEIVALCAGPPRAASGLDRLLGLLATYAVEVPRPVELPAVVARLAGGRSKTALEAQRLIELTGAAIRPEGDPPRRLGLWREESEPVPWALMFPPTRDLASIGRRTLDGPSDHQVSSHVRRSVLQSLLLDELGALVAEHGAEAVRAKIAAAEDPYGFSPQAHAVHAWARGLLTPEAFWAMTRTTRTAVDLLPGWDQELGPVAGASRLLGWTLSDGLQHTPPVMPRSWSEDWRGKLNRLALLHSCEVLLVLERGGHVVSTPDVVDGSLGLDHLWERLAAAPLVGPLDLRLALGRLRPDLRHPRPDGGGALVDAVLATPDASSNDGPGERAYDVVDRWVAGGGLRLSAAPGTQPGTWDHTGTCAVPWDTCAALESTNVVDGPVGARWDDAFHVPGRIDLWFRHGCQSHVSGDSPADVGGELGTAGWRALMDVLWTSTQGRLDLDLTFLVRLQDQGRLSPAPAVTAAEARWDDGTPATAGALGWERAMLRGALRGLWPVAVAVVEAGLARDERPADLDALLAALRRRAHEVPADLVPAFLVDA